WRWNFYINLPIGLIAFVMVSIFVHDPSYMRNRKSGGRIDYLGIIYLATFLGLLEIVLDRGQRSDWFSAPWVVWSVIISAAAMILLVWRETHIKDPILDLKMMRIPLFSTAVFLCVVLSFVLFGTGLLNPIFLQEFMGYTAWRAGLVLAPRAIGAMAAMLFAGQIARRGFDNKRLVGLSFALMTAGLWMMAHWNLQVGTFQIVFPGLVLGLGLGMCFPILSAAALSCVARERMGFAASIYNMMRNTGAAVGIAYMTNMLISHQQIHQSNLVEHFSVFDAWRMSSMAQQLTPGAPAFAYLPQIISGQKQGFGMVYGMIQQQAAMLAFNDIYRILAFITLLMIPSFLLLRGSRPAAGGSAAMH
ncbi:MAG: MFS transporter, partial [Candidatus Binataceae bacterium]